MIGTVWPAPRASWALVTLLTLAYLLSYVDRSILGLLIEPIKADIHLNDEQMGYLIGPAFAVFYATIGLPLGWLADRRRRTWIVSAGIAIWSLATAAMGFASTFWHAFAARMSVGVGEAALGPCAMSMIADSFPPEKRGKPVALYSSALSLGGGVAALLGAAVLTWAKTSEGLDLPFIGAFRPWQTAFLILGVPGCLLALAMLFMQEPPRQRLSEADQQQGAGVRAMFAYFLANAGAFVGLASLICVVTIIAYSQGFAPSAFARKFDWEVRDYALTNGVMILALGPATVTAVGVLCDRWRSAGRRDAPFMLLSIGFAAMVFFNAVAFIMPTAVLTFVMLGLGTMAIATCTTTGIISLLDITPSAFRGQIVALYYMTISMAGLFLGPTTVGVLSTRVFGEYRLPLAIAAVPLLYGAVPLLLLPLIRRQYLAQMRKMT